MAGSALRFTFAVAAIAVLFPTVDAATKTPAGVIAVPLSRDEGLTAYFSKLQVGTPPQTEYLKIDTGSPRYSFLDPRNEVCQREGNPCREFGTFDNKTSSTSRYKRSGFADALGYVGQQETGLSLECQDNGPSCTGNLPAYALPELKRASKINRMASSIYLGLDNKEAANAKMLLVGDYDKAKINGSLITVPIVDPHNMQLSDGQTNSINVTSIEVYTSKSKKHGTGTYGEKAIGVPVLLDTGIATWYLTDKTIAPIYSAFDVTKEPPAGQRYFVVDCKYADPTRSDGYISVEFGVHGKIKVPFQGLVSKFPDSTCGVFMATRGDEISTIGDPFLRNVYSIFDQEGLSISLGQVKHTAEENIVPFPRGGFKPTRL
ncbi:hypothetical protein ACHAPU_008411 [Fusarium lateritium]